MGIFLKKHLKTLKKCTPKKAGHEALETGIVFLIALLLSYFSIDVSNGVLPDFIEKTGIVGHKGFVCPLCGGTRAFVMTSTLKLNKALHYSMLGTLVSLWLLLTLPVRIFYRNFPENCRWRKSYLFVKYMEKADHLIIGMALFLWVQLIFHYALGFYWIPLLQL